jgi:hypothetical protein
MEKKKKRKKYDGKTTMERIYCLNLSLLYAYNIIIIIIHAFAIRSRYCKRNFSVILLGFRWSKEFGRSTKRTVTLINNYVINKVSSSCGNKNRALNHRGERSMRSAKRVSHLHSFAIARPGKANNMFLTIANIRLSPG